MSILVTCFVEPDFSFSIGSAGNDRNGFLRSKTPAKCIGIITLIRNQIAHGAGTVDQIICSSYVRQITGRQHQDVRSAQYIRQRMDLCPLSSFAMQMTAGQWSGHPGWDQWHSLSPPFTTECGALGFDIG